MLRTEIGLLVYFGRLKESHSYYQTETRSMHHWRGINETDPSCLSLIWQEERCSLKLTEWRWSVCLTPNTFNVTHQFWTESSLPCVLLWSLCLEVTSSTSNFTLYCMILLIMVHKIILPQAKNHRFYLTPPSSHRVPSNLSTVHLFYFKTAASKSFWWTCSRETAAAFIPTSPSSHHPERLRWHYIIGWSCTLAHKICIRLYVTMSHAASYRSSAIYKKKVAHSRRRG